METSTSNKYRRVTKEEVIAKIKDDGDFDKLRLMIIRKIKENQELRNNITSIVRQSVALNRPGSENMKPRQLSDAIFEEVGNGVMTQISDNVWEIIRSDHGMKNEIKETVQSVYDKLTNPETKEMGELPTHDVVKVDKGVENNGSIVASAADFHGTLDESELQEPPGFSLANNHQNNNCEEKHEEVQQLSRPQADGSLEEHKDEAHYSKDVSKQDDVLGVPPGFSAGNGQQQLCDSSDEDPDVPPGFG
ncbi:hypothetical protein HS088_TW20G00292 [Tripterygium wilfordii]|uniref:BOD1/SHG1 domain-containing protein n=1 Tax=Tripterygium wilfordii TaxID=458696 RepID=A0A7J7C7J8_TRIWF|nr:uncharacterized protein LOC119987255 [Tripterygium wilfordii]KAF5729925.1 hypothetical protein HS088_TW20G00292 [Tripterygium wilfordii]